MFLKSLGICVCMCVVSDFLRFNFCVFFRSLRICDVLGVKLLVIIIIRSSRICMYVIWGGGGEGDVKLLVIFRSSRICVYMNFWG